MNRTPRAIAVIIPARNEQDTIAECVRSVRAAASQLPTDVSFAVLVVADACTDSTARRAAHGGAFTLPINGSNVGRARAVGTEAMLRRWGSNGVWIACTDADSVVPLNWLVAQLEAAASGWDAVAGTVRIADENLHDAFERHYRPVAGHSHAHGANLGVRADAYLRVGGFPPLATGEDAGLLTRLHRRNFRILATVEEPVRTSARLHGRAPAGFAENLRSLAP
ncbi:glycosyltransferase [Saccharopolyspora sp. SCSIO 74807]|uniref:glycosyltransferase n=1 Tax=Saccharopolyspora sp. SCSIO 74807 TaxID=3118084 RepID=UPI0030CE0248